MKLASSFLIFVGVLLQIKLQSKFVAVLSNAIDFFELNSHTTSISLVNLEQSHLPSVTSVDVSANYI